MTFLSTCLLSRKCTIGLGNSKVISMFESRSKADFDNSLLILVLPTLSKFTNSWLIISKRTACYLLSSWQRLPFGEHIDRTETISHSSLLEKLSSSEIYDTDSNWFTDCLLFRGIFQRNGWTFHLKSVVYRVPQGSIIGSLLFIMHFNEAHSLLQNLEIITYADDTVVCDIINIHRDLQHTQRDWSVVSCLFSVLFC